MQLDADDEDTPFFKPVVQQTEPLVSKARREQEQAHQNSAGVDGNANGEDTSREAGPTTEDESRAETDE